MRKIILTACLFLSTIIACAQLTSNPVVTPYTNFTGIDYLFIFNGITPSTEISFTGTGTNINWYKFTAPTTSISSFSYISPEDGTGYTLKVDSQIFHIWVIDYKNYLPSLLAINDNQPDPCKVVNLSLNVPQLFYNTVDNVSHPIVRDFSINYKTLKWGGSAWTDKDTLVNVPVTLPTTQISVPTPFSNASFPNTTFSLSGDQYAKALGIDSLKVNTPPYTPVAVISYLTTTVASRDQGDKKNNEGNVPKTKVLPISFSAPIDVQFLSNGNEPITQFYNWVIYKDDKPIINRSDKDTRYTFTEFGKYKVKLTVSNSTCSFSDSITVEVSESAIYVPNIFTPNGDTYNDEFRVAYKSLISFQCWVFNRWGRQVFYWTDPTKGWDGNINGKKAVPGPYFYVIKATGSDKKVYKLKGDINLLR